MPQNRARAVRRRLGLALVMTLAAAGSLEPGTALGAPSSTLTRYPYLTDLVGDSVTVNWATARTSSVSGSVTVGEVGGPTPCAAQTVPATKTRITVTSVSQYQWRATVRGLRPDATYCYRVYLGSSPRTDLLGSDPSPTFTAGLPAQPTTPFSFAVFGDWGQANADSANPEQEKLLARMANSPARFAVSTGDIANPSGSQTNYGDLHHTGTRVSGVFGPRFWAVPGRSLPIFPAVGNHNPNSTFLLNWPQPQAVAGSKGRYQLDDYCCRNDTKSKRYASAWYAFDAGGARFYMLHAAWDGANVGTGTQYKNDYEYHWKDSAQYRWLEADLAEHASTPLKFAVFHYPLYSDQSSQSSDAFLQGAERLEGLLSRNGVDLAFNGHGHVYQRNLKPHPGSLVSYVSGGGGATPSSMGGVGCSQTNAYGIGWKGSRNTGSACGAAPVPAAPANVHHFLLVTVDGTRVTVAPTDADGATFDRAVYDFSSGGAGTPSAPAALSPDTVTTSQVKLSWPESADDIGVNTYTIYRDDLPVATVRGWTRTYTDRSLQAGTTYRYRVAATDGNANTSPSSPTATVTTAPHGRMLRFPPTKDTYIDADRPGIAFGAATRTTADHSPVKKTLMAFTVSGTGGCPIVSALLRLHNVDAALRGGDVRPLANTGWDEQTVTWATAPATNAPAVATLDAVVKKTWYDVDVTPLVSGDGPVGLTITSGSTDGAGYSSKEGPVRQQPELVVECTAT